MERSRSFRTWRIAASSAPVRIHGMSNTAHLRSSLSPCTPFKSGSCASKLGRGSHGQRGDTLVEVLMAIVVLSIVIVGAITLMTRGLRAAQMAVEHTQVRLEINSQLEMLRYLRDSYVTDPTSTAAQRWGALFTGVPLYSNTTPSNYDDSNCAVTTGKTGFYLAQSAGNVNINSFNPTLEPATHAIAGQGLWIEMTRSSGISPAYVDVLVRACWAGIGDAAEQGSVTAMRLYDPAH